MDHWRRHADCRACKLFLPATLSGGDAHTAPAAHDFELSITVDESANRGGAISASIIGNTPV